MPNISSIVVVGATGQLGKSVVQSLLQDTNFNVTALVRDKQGDKAKALLEIHASHKDRLSLAQGDVNNAASIHAAFEGAHGAFAYVNTVWAGGDEIKQMKTMVDAAKAVNLQQFVALGSMSIKDASKGHFDKCIQFEGKTVAEKYALEQLPKSATILHLATFFGNIKNYRQARREGDVVNFNMSYQTDCKTGHIDAEVDPGVFTAAIFNKGAAVSAGKTYIVGQRLYSPEDLARIYQEKTGDKAIATVLDTGRRAPNMPEWIADAYASMFSYLESMPSGKLDYGLIDPAQDNTEAELGVRSSTFEEWLERTGFRA